MTELIPIAPRQIGDVTVLAADARDLHRQLNVGADFNHWIARRIEEYKFEEGKDFQSFLAESTGGRPPKEYVISLDMAKELSMVERTPEGKEARQYFIECERQALAAQALALSSAEKVSSQTGLPEFRRARALDLATKTAERIVAQFPSLSEDSRRVVFAKVINPVAGAEILALPPIEKKRKTAGEVGELLGISANMVGRIANLHGLKTDEYGGYQLDKSAHSVKQVQAFVYNEDGVEAIKRHLDEADKPSTAPRPPKASAVQATAPAPEPQGALI